MLTLATNLLLWVLAVTNDSMHHEIEAELDALTEKFSGTERDQPFPQRTCALKLGADPRGWVMIKKNFSVSMVPSVCSQGLVPCTPLPTAIGC
jgi:hypothetical protein